MNCSTTATLAAFDIYESGAAIRRAGNDYTFLMFAVMIAVWLFAIPLTAHAGQDPLIGMNRSVHGFNKAMDTTVLKPLAETYTTVTPSFAKRRVTSFFNNIDDVRVIINDLLQLKIKRAAPFLQSAAFDGVGIDHRGANIAVAEHLLDRSNVVVGLQ